MKFLKKFALLGLLAPLLFSLLSFTTEGGDKEVLIIRVYENSYHPRITITSKDKTTLVELEKEKNEGAKDKNLEVATRTLERYLSEGYRMESSNSVINSNNNLHTTTYILTK